MFGYIREYPPELKLKHHTLYRAVYCGLCKSMGRCTGQCSRASLSYDAVFLALVRLALRDEPITVTPQKCILHPFKKHPMLEDNEALRVTARISALLACAKIEDDRADSRGLKRLAACAVHPMAVRAVRKSGCANEYERMKEHLDALADCERRREASFDSPAAHMAALGADSFSVGLSGSAEALARQIGHHTAVWVYAADALDDLKKDHKNGAYNPFLLLYGEKLNEEQAALTAGAMRESLCGIERALDLIDFKDEDIKTLAYHILYEGMRRKTDELVYASMQDGVKRRSEIE